MSGEVQATSRVLVRGGRWALVGLVLLGHGVAQTQEAPGPSRYQISLVGGTFTPPAQMTSAAVQAVESRAGQLRAAGRQVTHALVQLREIPTDSDRVQLASDGLDLGAYATGQAWVAAIPTDRIEATARRADVRYLELWGPERKLHPRVAARDFGSWTRDSQNPGWVMTFVLLHHDVSLDRISEIAAAVGGVALEPIESLHGATVWALEDRVAELAEIEDVLWVEEGPMPLSPTNDGARAQSRTDAVLSAPYNLTGSGVRLFVFDGGTVRATHETFDPGTGSRVTAIDGQAAADHPTHVAGTAAGDGSGSSGGRGRGVATGADVLSAGYQQVGGTMLFWDNAGDIQADYALARNTHDADLGTNSIGSNTASNGYNCAREGDYGVSSNLLDGIVRGSNATVGSPVIMTWSNGNERNGGTATQGRCGTGYVTTAPPSCAKNPIHIGAINSDGGSMTLFSSWGPCDDGRLKPVVSAPGCEVGRVGGESTIYSSLSTSDSAYGGFCGTSMATPLVGGIVSLLVEDWRDQGHGGAFARPQPALVKALLVHTARDLGQPGPDYIYGYGAVDAKALVDTMRAGDGSLGDLSGVNWGTDSLTPGLTDQWTFDVPAGTGELKATLAWDDAAAAAFAANAVVNNLNLELVSPSLTVFRAWILDPANPHLNATTGTNVRDNQEQVLVTNPEAGNWTVRVVGSSVPSGFQNYALVYSTSASPGIPSTTTYGFEAGNDGFVLSGASRVAAPAAGHGSFSLRFGGNVNETHEAYREIAVPATGMTLAGFYWYMTSSESTNDGNYDRFYAEVRNTAGTVLSTFDLRSDGWRRGAWMQQAKVDLTPWAGQTVRLAFRGTTDVTIPTTFWVDDVTVTSHAPPGPTLTINDVSVTEGNAGPANASFTVTLSPTASGTVTVQYATANETATAGADYTATSGTLTFNAGEGSKTVPVSVLGDSVFEGNEAFVVNLSNPTGGAVIGDGVGRGTILDDDGLTCPAQVDANAQFQATVSAGSSATDWVGVFAATAADTAYSAWKYVPLPRPQDVTFNAPATGGPHELRLFANGGFTRLATCPFTVVVPPSLTINDVSVTEGNAGSTNANFTVTLNPTASGTVTVQYATANETATAGADYTAASGTLTFNAGESSKPVAVAVLGDALAEANETFAVNLSNATGGAAIGDPLGRGTILDDDALTCPSPVNANAPFQVTVGTGSSATDWVGVYAAGAADNAFLSWKHVPLPRPQNVTLNAPAVGGSYEVRLFANNGFTRLATCPFTVVAPPSLTINDVSVTEGNAGSTNATFTVTLSPTSGGTVTVQYATANETATAGADYTAASGTLTFNAGESSKPVAVAVLGDALAEANETFAVNLSNATGGAAIGDPLGRGTILDDDALTCPSPVNANAPFQVTVGTGSSATDWVGVYAAGAADNAFLSWKHVPLPRPQNVTLNAPAVGGSYEVRLFANNGFTRLATCPFTVVAPPSLTINDVSVTEGNAGSTNANLTVTLNPVASGTVTVQYATANETATAGADYTATSGTLTFNAGEGSKQVSVPVLGDTLTESSETFVVNLTNATGGAVIGDGVGRGTILDDDALTCPAAPVNPGSQFNTTVGAGSSATDWVGVYAAGAADTAFQSWKYAPLPRPQTLSFTAPSLVGNYELRLFANNTFTRIATCPFAVAASANDNFANRVAVPAGGGTVTGSNATATKETGEPNHGGNAGGRSVWWTWTPSSTGQKTISTAGSGFDTLLGVYTGSAVNALGLVAQNDDEVPGSVFTSRVTFNAVAGTTYQIAVDGFNNGSGAAFGSIVLTVGGIDTDGDRLPDDVETNTGVFVGPSNTGTDPNDPDTDDDGIRDGDEVLGTTAGLDLPAMGSNPLRRDIFLEYDWFNDSLDCGTHSHRPTQAMVERVTTAFANAPVANRDGSTGVAIHHDFGQGGAFTGGNLVGDANGVIDGGVNDAEFGNHKAANFAANRQGIFHYVLMPHRYNTSSGSSGQAELPGNDLIVSLQCNNTTTNVANTIMHELGHNLNLQHGGNESCNWKPNYNSVMNYKYQFPGVDSDCTPPGNGVLDYSRGTRISLNENTLNENLGTCGTPAWDWNGNGTIQNPVAYDLNRQGDDPGDPADNSFCAATLTVLNDSDDWASLVYTGITSDIDGIPVVPVIIDCDNPAPRAPAEENEGR